MTPTLTTPGDATVPADALREAASLLRGVRVAVLTGAGVSTDSGIPDYRGDGSPRRAPMTFQQFASNPRHARRYWAGSHLGWRRFQAAAPNAAHRVLARLEDSGAVNGIVTQNVDGLHSAAGSRRVVELHGSMGRVRCLHCGQLFAREAIAHELERANPWLRSAEVPRLSPDGDVEVSDVDEVVPPVCTVCGGSLKPDVVFFGEFVPSETFLQARSLIDTADVLLVAGSSLAVNSGMRFLERARRLDHPIVIVNRGPTKGDERAAVKIDGGVGETLSALETALVGPAGSGASRGV